LLPYRIIATYIAFIVKLTCVENAWEEVTDERGRVRWTAVPGGTGKHGERLCAWKEGKEACREAVMELVWS